VVFARKPDLREIDRILKGLGITSKAVRDIIHREIWKGHYTLEEIEEIAEDIGKLITKGGKPHPEGGEPENPDGGGEE